jgi:hypothetical protein
MTTSTEVPLMNRLPLTPEMNAWLADLLAQGRAVLATKQPPKANIRCEYTALSPVYDVVADEFFYDWKEACLAFLGRAAGYDSDLYRQFAQICKFPNFFDAYEGYKLLQTVNSH